MKKETLILVAVLLQTVNLFAQNFHSDIEKEVFDSYQKDSIHYKFIKSICAIDTTFTNAQLKDYSTKIEDILTTVPEKQFKEKKEKKRVKQIYDTFHKAFLKKYELDSYFTDIFKTGNYNCVTASALYAYVFDKLQIPYHVKEAPSHVYLIAYPNSYKIYLETTAPGAYGFSAPKEAEVKKIVDELVNVKLVSKEELNTKGYKNMYNDYFYGKEFVRKSALIGMQYYNKSILNFQKEHFIKAENNLSKSLIFYNSPLANILYKDLVRMNINSLELNTDNDINLLKKYFSQLEYQKDYKKQEVLFYLYKIIENDDNDLDFIKKTAKSFNTLKNDALKNICKEELYNYISRLEANKFNFDSALQFSDSILKINKNSKIAKEVIGFALHKKIATDGSNEKSLKQLEKYYNDYSFLENDKRIETMRAVIYGEMTVKEIQNKKPDMALNYLEKFENVITNKKDNLIIRSDFYAFVYLKAGRYFYGKKKFHKARDIFKRGLKFVPEDSTLQKMFKWAQEDMN